MNRKLLQIVRLHIANFLIGQRPPEPKLLIRTICIRTICNKIIPFGVAAALLFSCGNKEEKQTSTPQAQSKSTNVILISIDTLRADYLKLYNPNGADTPNLQKFAENAAVFRNAIVQTPYTLPSHCSMLTGIYPITHQVRDNTSDALPKNMPTLAEAFQHAGYQTAGFVGSMVLRRVTGLSRGFDYYDDSFSRANVHGDDLGSIERSADEVLDSFENWMEKRQSDRHFFSFIHFYDPHSPYNPPPAFRPAQNDPKHLYIGEIKYVDFVLGKLFEYLRTKGLWQNTTFLITSDHGEMLNDHNELGHGFFVYQGELAVPMLLRTPDMRRTQQIDDVVQTVDIAPTLLDLAGVSKAGEMQGESLAPVVLKGSHKKNRLAFSESYFAALQFGVSPLQAVQDGTYKYIDCPKPELYDLIHDPSESQNLFTREKSITEKMKQRLGQYRAAYGNKAVKKEQHTVSAEEAEKFAALGYIGGGVSEQSWNYTLDPKDYADLWNDTLQASSLAVSHEYDKALALIQKINGGMKELPHSLLLLQAKIYIGLGKFAKAEEAAHKLGPTSQSLSTLAEIYAKTSRYPQAEEAYKKSLERDFSYFTLYNYVYFLKDIGRSADAIALVKDIEKKQPATEETAPFFAEIYLLLQQWDEAERRTVELLEKRPWELKWYIELANIYQNQGRPAKALNLLVSSRNRFSDQPEYYMQLGIVSRMAGNPKLEVESFRELINRDAGDPRGYLYLAKAMLDYTQNLDSVFRLTARGMQLSPDRSMQIFAHYILADAYQRAGQMPESQRQQEIARKLELNR